MLRLHKEGELADNELVDIMGFVNTIITHITNGNQNEERLVKIMGGTVIETESEKLIRQGVSQGMSQGIYQGKIQMIIEIGLDNGLDNTEIVKKLQDKLGLSPEKATVYLEEYGKLFKIGHE
jgi:hypothetical protein